MHFDSPTGSHGLNDTTANELEQTIGSLEAGVTSLAPSTAIGIIDVWYDTLKNAEGDGLHAIANLLDDLRTHLRADRLDGRSIGDLMARLGTATRAVAGSAEDSRVGPQLERLAAVLTRAGQALGAKTVDAHRPEVGRTAKEIGETEKNLRGGGRPAPGA
ncbi:MAG: hypothetical protein R3362_02415 [Rhodothermales bacterium]|nr:hypothetical protein [Rhodothermales bacterium]